MLEMPHRACTNLDLGTDGRLVDLGFLLCEDEDFPKLVLLDPVGVGSSERLRRRM
jgi:hypothetical protein